MNNTSTQKNPVFIAAVFALMFFWPMGEVKALPANFQVTQIIGSGLGNATALEFAPDGRIFILERQGKVRIYKNGALLAQPFTTIPVSITGDRGLLGIAFDPEYAANHYVYFYYNGPDSLNHIARFDASGDTASAGPAIIYSSPAPSGDPHMGGTIAFGPDGKLYAAFGDSGRSVNAQDLSVPFGKILRLNPDGTVPSDNPFVGQAGKLPEIWANGLRNPFRFQFDALTGKLYAGDVGETTWEEINVVARGGNYGWPTCEGACGNPNFINPFYAYNHNGGSGSVTGGPIYRGNMFPSQYYGQYFFGDYALSFIRNLPIDVSGDASGIPGTAGNFHPGADTVVDMKVAPDGSLYYVTIFPGQMFRISYSTGNQIPIASAGSDKTGGPTPLTVNFTSAGTSDQDGDPLTYLWDFGDGTTSTSSHPTKIYSQRGTFTAELAVSDPEHLARASPIIIQAGTPPVITIEAPASTLTYKAGDVISYSASAIDEEGGALAASDLTTEILFHHDTHLHPFLGPMNGGSGSFTAPTTGEVSAETWFEIKFTATDGNGLSASRSVAIHPQKADITFDTAPSGLKILLDGQPIIAPKTIAGVVGFTRELSVAPNQIFSGKTYLFDRWSDNGQQSHAISTPAVHTTYTAFFTESSPWSAEYFNNQTLSGTPVLIRDDPVIAFDWDRFSPHASIASDHFSVRWTKTENFTGGTYEFRSTSDDGIRMYVDGELVIDKWINQGPTTYTATRSITPGDHTIIVEYYEDGGGAQIYASYLRTGSATPPPPPPPATSTAGYLGEYWNVPGTFHSPKFPATTPHLTRTDNAVSFNWDRFSPGAPIGSDHFVARWTRRVTLEGGTYQFRVNSDDGARVYLDGELVINRWIDQGLTAVTATRSVAAGEHDLKIEHYENGGGAQVYFRYLKL